MSGSEAVRAFGRSARGFRCSAPAIARRSSRQAQRNYFSDAWRARSVAYRRMGKVCADSPGAAEAHVDEPCQGGTTEVRRAPLEASLDRPQEPGPLGKTSR